MAKKQTRAVPNATGGPPPPQAIAVDARILQHEHLRHHILAQAAATLLAARPGPNTLIALTDPRQPPLTPDHRALFDAIRPIGAAIPGAAFLSLSPMTDSALPFARILRGPHFTAALLDELPGPASGLEHAARLAWLRDYDHLYPLSGSTSLRLRELTGIPPAGITITGFPLPETRPPAPRPGRYLLVTGDATAPISAHARSAILDRTGIRLVICGDLPPAVHSEWTRRHQAEGGDPALLEFLPPQTAEQRAPLHAAALAVIASSHAGGLPLPVLEAAAQACPVIAANGPAHAELLPFDLDLFEPGDIPGLQLRMEILALQPSARAAAQARQAGLALRFAAQPICTRFWDDLSTRLQAHAARHAPAVLRGARPSLAFATPLPPDKSGVADYSHATLAALGGLAEIHVYTETVSPDCHGLPIAGVHPLGPMAYLSARHDATISVLGNSHFHLGVFREFMEWGGASIAHDARMLNFYYEALGEPRALAAAATELNRPVSPDDLQAWLADQNGLPALFLDEIARASSPMFVHSPITSELLAARGLPSVTLPFAPYRVLPDEELTRQARHRARSELGIPDTALLIATFGTVMRDRAILDGLAALHRLRAQGLDAVLACVGAISPPFEDELRDAAAALGVAPHVILMPEGVSERVYRLWMRAADLGMQLRTYQMGGLSGALMDCIAAALPTVVNDHLAAAMDSPAWVHRVPDAISAEIIAERLTAMHAAGLHLDRPLEARRDMLETRGFAAYARRLLQSLGLDPR